MQVRNALMGLVMAGIVAACGGGGSDAGTSPFDPNPPGGGGATTVSDLVVESSKATVANTGSDTVLITTTAIDSARNVVADAPVQVTADNDAIVVAAAATTGADSGQSGPGRAYGKARKPAAFAAARTDAKPRAVVVRAAAGRCYRVGDRPHRIGASRTPCLSAALRHPRRPAD